MRLDNWLIKNSFFTSRSKAIRFIREKGVIVNAKKVNKPSFSIQPHHTVELDEIELLKYSKPVGYHKLEKLASNPDFPPFTGDDRCLDLGANVGGFSLYMLEQGVASVFAIEISPKYEPHLMQIKENWPNFSYRIANFFELDLPDTYDFITADLTIDPHFLAQNFEIFAKLLNSARIPARLVVTIKLGMISDSKLLLKDLKRSAKNSFQDASIKLLKSLPGKQEQVLLLITT